MEVIANMNSTQVEMLLLEIPGEKDQDRNVVGKIAVWNSEFKA